MAPIPSPARNALSPGERRDGQLLRRQPPENRIRTCHGSRASVALHASARSGDCCIERSRVILTGGSSVKRAMGLAGRAAPEPRDDSEHRSGGRWGSLAREDLLSKIARDRSMQQSLPVHPRVAAREPAQAGTFLAQAHHGRLRVRHPFVRLGVDADPGNLGAGATTAPR